MGREQRSMHMAHLRVSSKMVELATLSSAASGFAPAERAAIKAYTLTPLQIHNSHNMKSCKSTAIVVHAPSKASWLPSHDCLMLHSHFRTVLRKHCEVAHTCR